MSTEDEYSSNLEELNRSLELLNQTIANDTSNNKDLIEQQKKLQELIEHEKEITVKHVNNLEKEKKTEQRRAMLNKNAGDRLRHYNYIVIYLVIGIAIYIIIYYIEKTFPIFPTWLINILKIAVVSIVGIYCIRTLITINSRDPLNFDKLNLVKPNVYTKEEAQRAQEQAENEGDLTSSSSLQASNLCSGNACCGTDTVWDEEKMLCVPVNNVDTFSNIRPNEPADNYNIYT